MLFPLSLYPGGKMDKVKWILTWPLIFLLFFTIPNCSKPRWENFFMLTFILSTLWIALFSYFMVWLVSECKVVCFVHRVLLVLFQLPISAQCRHAEIADTKQSVPWHEWLRLLMTLFDLYLCISHHEDLFNMYKAKGTDWKAGSSHFIQTGLFLSLKNAVLEIWNRSCLLWIA